MNYDEQPGTPGVWASAGGPLLLDHSPPAAPFRCVCLKVDVAG
jgi:hypothetical protein